MSEWGVIPFKDVDDSEAVAAVFGNRKAHGVGGAGSREMLANAARVSAIAELTLMLFRWSEGRAGSRQSGIAETETGVAQGQPGKVDPGQRLQLPLGSEKRTGHAAMLTERYANSLDATRIDILKQLLEQNPASTFARYGLAMEYVKAGELEMAIAEFKAVAAADPGYSAAYFQGAQTLEKLGRLGDARGLYREGIAKTRDDHARAEMQAALDVLGPDD